MLLSRLSMEAPDLGASARAGALLHPGFWFRTTTHEGLIVDEGLGRAVVGSTGPEDWPMLTVLLEGAACVRVGGKTIWGSEPGEASVVPERSGARARVDGRVRAQCITLQWDPRWLGTTKPKALQTLRLGEREIALLREAAGAIDAEPTTGAMRRPVFAALSALGSAGLPLPPLRPRDLDVPVTENERALAAALDQHVVSLRGLPMTCDLEESLGVSRQHIGRRFRNLTHRFHLPHRSWRELRNAWRLKLGSLLMTAPLATTERVAARLGYGNPAALCRAFAAADLPSPGQVRERIAALL